MWQPFGSVAHTMTGDYLLLALLWAAYCAVHSTLVSIPITDWFKAVLASRYRFYRLLFNSFSIITLVPLLMYSNSARFPSQPLFAWTGQREILRCILIGLGVVLFVTGARHYGMLQFLGIGQLRKESSWRRHDQQRQFR